MILLWAFFEILLMALIFGVCVFLILTVIGKVSRHMECTEMLLKKIAEALKIEPNDMEIKEEDEKEKK